MSVFIRNLFTVKNTKSDAPEFGTSPFDLESQVRFVTVWFGAPCGLQVTNLISIGLGWLPLFGWVKVQYERVMVPSERTWM
jgi:hypothetical protein